MTDKPPKMATEEKGEWLTNRQIMMLAARIPAEHMENIAQKYMRLSEELIDSVKKENTGDSEEFSRIIIRRWANMNSEDQVKVCLNIKCLNETCGCFICDGLEALMLFPFNMSKVIVLFFVTTLADPDFSSEGAEIVLNTGWASAREQANINQGPEPTQRTL